jgi:phage-related protein (TIGR01555 family)
MNGNMEIKIDGWYNVLTGLGMSATDKRMSTSFSLSSILDDETLIDIFRGEGIGRKIINIPVNDMVRNWFRIESDTDNTIISYLSKLNAKKYVKSALRWSKLFGGSILFMGIDDGQEAEKPVNKNAIKGIRFFEVYDKRQISWLPDDLYNDKMNVKFGQPERYTIVNPTTGTQFKVHESRCLVFRGEDLPGQELNNNRGWGDSKLQAIFSRLRGVCDSLEGVEGINTEFIIGIMKINNLQQLLSSKSGEEQLRNRLHVMDLTKHSLNTIAIDKNEEFERASSFGVTGLRDLIDVLIDVVCGMSGIPRVKLIGDQSKGIGGGAKGNIRLYYDDIAADQDDELAPQLNKMVEYVTLAKDSNSKVTDPKITFNKLYQQSEKEEAETKLLNAKTDSLYAEMGLPPEYIILSRFGGKAYGYDIKIPKEYSDALAKATVAKLVKRIEEVVKKNMDVGKKNEMKTNGVDPGQTSKDNPGRE